MTQSSILGPSGSRMVEFGGTKAWKITQKGDIVISFQWLDVGHESGEPQACMCLYPVNRRMDTGAYVLPQEQMYRFADAKGKMTPAAMGAAFKYCAITNTFPDKSTVHRIMDILWENLPELQRMPSSIPADAASQKQIQGIEVALKVGDKIIHEAVV